MKHSVSGRAEIDDLERGTEEFIARATTRAITEAGDLMKTAWRDQILRAGHGERLARTIRSAVYPRAASSVDAATLVWTKAADIIDSMSRGATITARNGGRFLAIPTEDVPKKRQGNALSPEEVEDRFGRRLQFISPGDKGFWTPSIRRNGVAFLVLKGLRIRKASGRWRNATANEVKRGKETSSVVMFILVPRVTVKKTLDREEIARLAELRYPDLLSKHWR